MLTGKESNDSTKEAAGSGGTAAWMAAKGVAAGAAIGNSYGFNNT
jgi:hypothetical protein